MRLCAFMRACVRVAAGGRCISTSIAPARLAQSAERKALNLVVVGSSPTVGAFWPAAAEDANLQKRPFVAPTLRRVCAQTRRRQLRQRPALKNADPRAELQWLTGAADARRVYSVSQHMLRIPAALQSDSEGIRTPASRAQWISSPSP